MPTTDMLRAKALDAIYHTDAFAGIRRLRRLFIPSILTSHKFFLLFALAWILFRAAGGENGKPTGKSCKFVGKITQN